jgi:UDP-N-acetylmuramate dehydrogenase
MNQTLTPPPVPLVEHEPLARHTSWRIGGPARYYAEVTRPDQAAALAHWAAAADLPLLWLGGGTNLLARDAGFPGVVARYTDRGWSIEDRGDTAALHVGAGAPMAGTARRVGAMGWAGLEWAEGVPGTIGGAVFGNAGCYGGDVAGQLEAATLLVGGAVEEWPEERMGYSYRSSALKDGHRGMVHAAQSAQTPPLVLAAVLGLSRGDPAAIAATMRRIAAERKGKTPWGSSCGSVFKNPPGNSAGRLIEQAGLKGRRVGAAEISERHANYIVNLGGASSDDVLGLVELARETVLRQFGVELELEVKVL